MFIEFKDLDNNAKISINLSEISAYEQTGDMGKYTIIHLKTDQRWIVENSYTSVKTKINNALKRIAKGAQGDSETEIKTT